MPKLSPEDLVLAFRQAKHQMASEKKNLSRSTLAKFERNLPKKLEPLRRQLERGSGLFDYLPLGNIWVVPKRAIFDKREQREINRPNSNEDARLLSLSTRVALEPSPYFACAEVLWLWNFGPALELLLSTDCVANRLRRSYKDSGADRYSRFIYKYWQEAYRKFMDDGIAQAEKLLQDQQSCLVLSLDLESCYDNIDPSFLLSGKFIDDIARLSHDNKVTFDQQKYRRDTNSLIKALKRFSKKAYELMPIRSPRRGIPIGGIASGLISNLALAPVDEQISRTPNLAYFRRYVDDLFLVIKKRETPSDDEHAADQINVMKRHASTAALAPNDFEIDPASVSRSGCRFVFRAKKIRSYFLEGRQDTLFLKKIREDRETLSSEFRVFIEPPSHNTRIESFSISADGEKINVLRDADRLKLRRYGSSIQLSRIEQRASLLDAEESWQVAERDLRPIATTASDPLHWIDFLDSLLRCIRISTQTKHYPLVQLILRRITNRIDSLLGQPERHEKLTKPGRKKLLQWFRHRILETLASSMPLDESLSPEFLAEFPLLFPDPEQTADELSAQALNMYRAGLRLPATMSESTESLTPKVIWPNRRAWIRLSHKIQSQGSETIKESLAHIEEYLKVASATSGKARLEATPIQTLISASPPTYFDVAWAWARASRNLAEVHRVVNSLRGTNYQDSHLRRNQAGDLEISGSPVITFPRGKQAKVQNCRLTLGNLVTDHYWFKSAAKGQPVHSEERLSRIAKVLNLTLGTNHTFSGGEDRPDPQDGAQAWLTRDRAHLLVLPELSLPRKWLPAVAQTLAREGVNLIAGLEYSTNGQSVRNVALGLFPTGLARVPVVRWQKRRPAAMEVHELGELGLEFDQVFESDHRIVVKTPFGKLSTLICSELLEPSARADLIGRVELVAVPAWNKDTATFDHTISTAALDMHCIIALANNGTFSDCRIRGPLADRWLRDIGRLINRNTNDILKVDLNAPDDREGPNLILRLRRFHKQATLEATTTQQQDDKPAEPKPFFKPVPPDFPRESSEAGNKSGPQSFFQFLSPPIASSAPDE